MFERKLISKSNELDFLSDKRYSGERIISVTQYCRMQKESSLHISASKYYEDSWNLQIHMLFDDHALTVVRNIHIKNLKAVQFQRHADESVCFLFLVRWLTVSRSPEGRGS